MANIVTILISIAGLLTLVAGLSLWLCFGRRKQYSPEKQRKKNNDELSDIEDGRCTCINCGVATKNDANVEPTLTTNVQSTSSVDHVIHIEAVAEVKHHNIQPVRGLKNLRNTCYFNSTMQALVHTNCKLREELELLSTKGEFIEEVLKFFRAMQSDISRPYSPRKLHRLFGKRSKSFANHEQHDSHECLRNFLDNIRKEEREILGAVDKQRVLTVVDSVFGGHFITVYICEDCETPYYVFEALLDISLPTMIDEKALADMNSTRISNQNQSMTVKPRQKTSKRMLHNTSDFAVQHKSTDQSKSNTENSIAEIPSTAIFVHPVVTDKDDDAEKDAVVEDRTAVEYDKQNVSQVTVEEIKDIAEQEEEQAQHKGSKENDDKEVQKKAEEEIKQANNEVKCTGTTVNEDEEENVFYDAREEVKHEQDERADDHEVIAEVVEHEQGERADDHEVTAEITEHEQGERADDHEVIAEVVEHEPGERADDHEVIAEVAEHEQDERADDDKVAAELDDFEEVTQEDGDHYREAIDSLMTPLSLSSPYLPNDETAIQKHVTVHDCLSYFTRKEHITKEYLCNDCNGRNPSKEGEDPLLTSATKQTLIFNPPAILTLHLKRFELKEGGSVKRNDLITYEELLDIAPYCSSRCLRNYPPCQNIWYSLYGVVVHHGSTLKFGHYTAYVKTSYRESDASFGKLLQKNFFDRDVTREHLVDMMKKKKSSMAYRPTCKQPNGTWYCMDDSSCRKVSVTTVLNQEAYVLFYERMS